jgi:hypothetical protein
VLPGGFIRSVDVNRAAGDRANDDAERLATCIVRAEALGWRASQGQRPAALVVDAVCWLATRLAAAPTAGPAKATRVACALPEPAVVALGARLRAAGVPIGLPGARAAPAHPRLTRRGRMDWSLC